jgi:hypothetical protein
MITILLDPRPIPVMAFQTAAGLIEVIGQMKTVLQKNPRPIPVMAFQTVADLNYHNKSNLNILFLLFLFFLFSHAYGTFSSYT